MNLSLKKLKFHEDMSEETPCFSADLYDGGKLIAHVSNRGHGGCNNVIPAKGLSYKDVAHLDNLDTDCDIMGLAEELNFHLFKLAHAKDELTCDYLISKSLTDLCDTERNLLTGSFLNVQEIDKDALSSLRSQIQLPFLA